MKASELRIGNWVEFCNSKGEPYEQIQIGFGDFSFMADIVKLKKLQSHPYYNPIPLTEEWLLKFGFEAIGDYKIWTKRRYQIEKHPGYKKGLIFFIGHGHTPECIQLNCVHQLQNLYFALTGEDLTLGTL